MTSSTGKSRDLSADKSARTGYSGKPLFQKLGLKEGDRLTLLNAPADYFNLLELPASKLAVSADLEKGARFVHGFYEDVKSFQASFTKVKGALAPDGAYWVSWRKGKVSDLTEDVVRRTALQSGLKLVVRKENRK